jgi:hypothetical protein
LIAALYLVPDDDRCPGCALEDCRCDYDAESEALYEATLALAAQVAETDAAYREWARALEPAPLRRAA